MAKTKEAYIRQPDQLGDLEKGKEVALFYKNGQEFAGIFQRLDDNEIILKSLKGGSIAGFPIKMLSYYFERIK